MKSQFTLSLLFAGTGGGIVSGATDGWPAAFSVNTALAANITSGAAVTLTPQPDVYSTFTGWTMCDTVNGTICTFIMTDPRTVTATFSAKSARVKIDGDVTPYYSLVGVLDSQSDKDRTVRALAQDFTGDIVMSSPNTTFFRGGYTDTSFVEVPPNNSMTVLNGSLVVRNGKLVADHLVIR